MQIILKHEWQLLMTGVSPGTPSSWMAMEKLGSRSTSFTHSLSKWLFVICLSHISVSPLSQAPRMSKNNNYGNAPHRCHSCRVCPSCSDMAGYCLLVCMPVRCSFGKSENACSLIAERCVKSWTHGLLGVFGESIKGSTHTGWVACLQPSGHESLSQDKEPMHISQIAHQQQPAIIQQSSLLPCLVIQFVYQMPVEYNT